MMYGNQLSDAYFEYQSKNILQSIWNDFHEDCDLTESNFEDWLWDNKEELGQYFYERLDEYCGIETIIKKLEL